MFNEFTVSTSLMIDFGRQVETNSDIWYSTRITFRASEANSKIALFVFSALVFFFNALNLFIDAITKLACLFSMLQCLFSSTSLLE